MNASAHSEQELANGTLQSSEEGMRRPAGIGLVGLSCWVCHPSLSAAARLPKLLSRPPPSSPLAEAKRKVFKFVQRKQQQELEGVPFEMISTV